MVSIPGSVILCSWRGVVIEPDQITESPSNKIKELDKPSPVEPEDQKEPGSRLGYSLAGSTSSSPTISSGVESKSFWVASCRLFHWMCV